MIASSIPYPSRKEYNYRYNAIDWGKETYSKGIPLSLMQDNLREITLEEESSYKDRTSEATIVWIERLGSSGERLVERRCGKNWRSMSKHTLESKLWDLPFELWEENLSVQDMICWNHFQCIQNSVSEEIACNPHYRFYDKLRLSLWHWGHTDSWNYYVKLYKGMRNFDFGPGFEVYLDHTTGYNERGLSQYTRTYLDGELAYLIYHKGEHVLTISISPTRYGVLVNQIQLKQKRGNRWLFKLGCPYFSYCLQRIVAAFAGVSVWLAKGKSMVVSIWQYSDQDHRKTLTAEVFDHIEKIYDQKLVGLKRTRAWIERKGIRFVCIKPL